jgi:CheY-like chemotaxis protein
MRFWSLCLNSKQNTNTVTSTEQQPARSSMKIPDCTLTSHLICDDSSFNRLVLKRFLNLIGIAVEESTNASETIEKVKQNGQYAVIWTDFNLGTNGSTDLNMNGAQMTEYLRKSCNYKGKIIIVSGFTDEKTKNMCFNAGVDNFVPKPIDRNQIKQISQV